jgi:hypothetical protein
MCQASALGAMELFKMFFERRVYGAITCRNLGKLIISTVLIT